MNKTLTIVLATVAVTGAGVLIARAAIIQTDVSLLAAGIWVWAAVICVINVARAHR